MESRMYSRGLYTGCSPDSTARRLAYADEGANFGLYFFLSKFLARDGLVLQVVRTVNASVYAVIGEVQRGEEDDSVAVELLFDFCCQIVDTLLYFRVVAIHQDCSLPVGQAFAFCGFLQDFKHAGAVAAFARGFL